MKCVLVGNYGVGNIGDEALKEYFLSKFPDISWSIVSAHPTAAHDIPRLPLGVRSLFAPWWKTINAIRHADALIFGGGSLFTDIESVWACVIWRTYAILASWFKVPVMLAFQGAGPWKTGLGLRLAKKTYQSAAFISVRDEDSLRRLEAFHLAHPPTLSFDPAFAFFATKPRISVSHRLVLIPRANSNEKFFEEAQKKLSENFSDVHILLMQPDDIERRVGKRLKAICTVPALVIELTSVQHLLDEVSAASEVLSQRFHGTLAAFAMGIPARSVPQHAGDKMDTLNERMNDASARTVLLTTVKTGSDALRQAMRGVSSL